MSLRGQVALAFVLGVIVCLMVAAAVCPILHAAMPETTAVDEPLIKTLPEVMAPVEPVQELGTCTVVLSCVMWSDDEISCEKPSDYRTQCTTTLTRKEPHEPGHPSPPADGS
jgi:hypothetical protein